SRESQGVAYFVCDEIDPKTSDIFRLRTSTRRLLLVQCLHIGRIQRDRGFPRQPRGRAGRRSAKRREVKIRVRREPTFSVGQLLALGEAETACDRLAAGLHGRTAPNDDVEPAPYRVSEGLPLWLGQLVVELHIHREGMLRSAHCRADRPLGREMFSGWTHVVL